MFKLIKYIILAIIILALIYFLRVSFRHNAMEITLKNPQKLQNIEQKTQQLKRSFGLFNKQSTQPTGTTVEQEKKTVEDKQELDRFIQQHSN